MKIMIIAHEGFRLLRRDKIFVPAIFACLFITFFANLASDWGVDEFKKFLVDIGFFGFYMMGNAISIFWGVKLLIDARESGALEVALSAPISRISWFLGRYLGLAAALLSLAAITLCFWQGLMLLNEFGWMSPKEVAAFAFIPLTWLVVAAFSMAVATATSQGIAVFACISLWLTGQTSALVAAALPSEASPLSQILVKNMARYWNLQELNLTDLASGFMILSPHDLAWRGCYGLLLVSFFLGVGGLNFHYRDAI